MPRSALPWRNAMSCSRTAPTNISTTAHGVLCASFRSADACGHTSQNRNNRRLMLPAPRGDAVHGPGGTPPVAQEAGQPGTAAHRMTSADCSHRRHCPQQLSPGERRQVYWRRWAMSVECPGRRGRRQRTGTGAGWSRSGGRFPDRRPLTGRLCGVGSRASGAEAGKARRKQFCHVNARFGAAGTARMICATTVLSQARLLTEHRDDGFSPLFSSPSAGKTDASAQEIVCVLKSRTICPRDAGCSKC